MSAAWIAGAALLAALAAVWVAGAALSRALDAEARSLRLERRVLELERHRIATTRATRQVVRIDGRRPTLPVEDRRRPR